MHRVHSGAPLCQGTNVPAAAGFRKAWNEDQWVCFKFISRVQNFALSWKTAFELECICVLAIGGSFDADVLPSQRDIAQ